MFSWIVVFERDFCEATDLSKQKNYSANMEMKSKIPSFQHPVLSYASQTLYEEQPGGK